VTAAVEKTKKKDARVAGVGRGSDSKAYIAALLSDASWKVAVSLALVVCVTATQGAQLLLLIPLMQLVGLDVQQGSVGWLSELVSSVFGVIGVHPTLVTVLGAYVLLSALQALVARWQAIFNLKLNQGFVASLRRRLYRAIANADWLTLTRSRSSDFTHALTTELDRVGAATYYVLSMSANGLILLVYVLLALQLSWVMTALVFLCGAALLLMLRKRTRAARWSGEEISFATNGLYAAAVDHLAGLKTTKSYGVEERSAGLFSDLAGQVANMYLNATRVYADAGFWFQVGSTLTLSVILYIAFEVLVLPTAGLLLLLYLFTRIIPLFASIQQSYQQYLTALPAFAGVMELQERCDAAAEPRVRGEKIELREGIRLKRVSFAYDEHRQTPAVRDLDITIEAGKTTAIVGPSGAGKSTVADLVMGLLLPSEGRC